MLVDLVAEFLADVWFYFRQDLNDIWESLRDTFKIGDEDGGF